MGEEKCETHERTESGVTANMVWNSNDSIYVGCFGFDAVGAARHSKRVELSSHVGRRLYNRFACRGQSAAREHLSCNCTATNTALDGVSDYGSADRLIWRAIYRF